MADKPYLYVILESNGHAAVAHREGDWQGESVQVSGRTPEGGKARTTVRELCERYHAPVIDLRGCKVEQDFPLCIDVFTGYRGWSLHLDDYLRWMRVHGIPVIMPEKA